ALAAGSLAPVATLILVLLTLFGALPIYRRVAAMSPHGEGSIAMLEHLLPWWQGKLFVLCLLGFVATDFIITITLSAADATAHIIENPLVPHFLSALPVELTLVLVIVLGLVFLKGFREAIGLAVVLVGIYLLLNLVTITMGLQEIVRHPGVLQDWRTTLLTSHGNPLMLLALAALVFPKLALGLSGFETGVAVMPLVQGHSSDTSDQPRGRIRNTYRLLTTAAVIMSFFLTTSSLVTTLLIPAAAFQPGGPANGRALAYLAHDFLGDGFGTLYDLSTISILWFAGASAMAGLLSIVPRYLPRYGMAPSWTLATRPLVLIFTLIALVVTLIFRADVEAQGGAYATGVLVLMSSASLAVTLALRRAAPADSLGIPEDSDPPVAFRQWRPPRSPSAATEILSTVADSHSGGSGATPEGLLPGALTRSPTPSELSSSPLLTPLAPSQPGFGPLLGARVAPARPVALAFRSVDPLCS
ncbi:MAG: hypothetical protein ACKO63_08255, partial [Nodosilinea sp.]